MSREPVHRIVHEGPVIRPGSAKQIEGSENEGNLVKNPIKMQLT